MYIHAMHYLVQCQDSSFPSSMIGYDDSHIPASDFHTYSLLAIIYDGEIEGTQIILLCIIISYWSTEIRHFISLQPCLFEYLYKYTNLGG